VQKVTNFNGIEDLMAVHLLSKNKVDVYESQKKEFKEIFTQLEVLDKQRVEINSTISANIGAFSHIVAKVSGESEKSDFFRKLDQAVQV